MFREGKPVNVLGRPREKPAIVFLGVFGPHPRANVFHGAIGVPQNIHFTRKRSKKNQSLLADVETGKNRNIFFFFVAC